MLLGGPLKISGLGILGLGSQIVVPVRECVENEYRTLWRNNVQWNGLIVGR